MPVLAPAPAFPAACQIISVRREWLITLLGASLRRLSEGTSPLHEEGTCLGLALHVLMRRVVEALCVLSASGMTLVAMQELLHRRKHARAT